MTANITTFGRLAFGASANTYTQFMHFIDHSLGLIKEVSHGQDIRGSLEHISTRSRIIRRMVNGDVNMEPSASEIDYWLPKILFGATSGGVTSVSDTPAAAIYSIWDAGDNVFEWTKLVVDRATISGAQGQPIRLAVSLEGQDEAKDDGTAFPNTGTAPPATDGPFVFSDVTMTLDGTSYEIDSFSLTVDYARIKDRFNNALTRSEIPPTDRIVTLGMTVPFNADQDTLYDMAIAGVAGSLAISDGTSTYTFDFANLKKPTEKIGSRGRTELKFPMNFQSFNDGTNPSIKCTKT